MSNAQIQSSNSIGTPVVFKREHLKVAPAGLTIQTSTPVGVVTCLATWECSNDNSKWKVFLTQQLAANETALDNVSTFSPHIRCTLSGDLGGRPVTMSISE